MIDIRGKNALITGSSRGVGQQIAIGLARLGCNIVIHGRSRENCGITESLLVEFPITTHCVYGDLSDENQIENIIQQVNRLNIDIDILYNNAAIMTDYRQNFWEHKRDDWMAAFKVNVIAVYDLCGAFIPKMIEKNFGRVINLTSGIANEPELAPYGASKWAVNKLTEDIASKLKHTSVRINTLDPGWLQTDMGGKNADHPVEAVLPGALAPALIEDDGPNGKLFSAIDHDLQLPN